ncbi:MAG: T9SS type A sorting domain-containing protein [Bacteroidales bacterium]|nr:T9SS type A sorting domain-containing protein [Bacteroidales bacterium]
MKIQKILLLIALLSFTVFSKSQSLERFDKLYSNPPIDYAMRNIMVTDSNYILVGNGYDPNTPEHSIIIILWFDKYGNFVNEKSYGDTVYFFGPITPYGNTLHKDNSGHYYLFYVKTNWDYTEYYNYVVKFNSQFDTLWVHQSYAGSFGVADTAVFRLTNGIIDTAGNIYIVGGTSVTENGDTILSHSSLYVEKLDSMGNQLWLHTYEIGHSYGDNAVIDPQTNHLWIGGVSETRPGVFEISPDGQLLWFHTFETPYWIDTTPIFIEIIPGTPGTVFASGAMLWNESVPRAFSSIIRNHQIYNEWYYDSSFTSTGTLGSSVRPNLVLPDTSIISIIGKGWNIHYPDSIINILTIYNHVYEFDKDGNVLWQRNFYLPITDNPPYVHHFVPDIAYTDDGGFIAAGWGFDTNQVYKAILAKFDSLGCNGYHSCADTAMVLDLLTPIDTVCTGDTLWMNFHLDGLSAPYTFTSSMGDTVTGIYYAKDSIYLYAYNPSNGLSADDSTQYISYDIYQQYAFVPETSWTDTLISLQITLTGAYGRTITHSYNIPVKDCSVGIVKPEFAMLRIFPNPATGGVVNIEATLTNPAFLSLYDNTGKSIQTMRLEAGTHTFQLKQKLPQGMYFISIWNEKGTTVKKLIVN